MCAPGWGGPSGSPHAKGVLPELDRLGNRFANVLAERGVSRGDRVAIVMRQRPEVLVAHLGISKRGAIAVSLSKLLAASALEYRLGHSGTAVVVADAPNAAGLGVVDEFKYLNGFSSRRG